MNGRARRAYLAWAAADIASLSGTRLSMVALPWLVLTTTGSAAQTGVVVFAEMAPYVLAKALAGPLIDRLGTIRVAVSADLASVPVIALIPALHAAGLAPFPALLALVALAGALRGPGDAAKHANLPQVADAARAPLERVTGLASTIERLAGTVGAAAAGVLVGLVGPATSLAVNAAAFAVSAACLGWGLAPVLDRATASPTAPDPTSYRVQLRLGWDFLRRDQVLVAIVLMVGVTNLLDQAWFGVLVPVWALDSGRGAPAVGLLFATMTGAAVVGAALAAAVGPRVPRFATYVVAFLISGMPRFVILIGDVPLGAVLAVLVTGGFASGFLNPILSAVIMERIPRPLLGRVTSLVGSLTWSLIPFGGLVGGALVAGPGLAAALVVCGTGYLLATMAPVVLPTWRQLDRRAPREGPDPGVESA